MENICKFIPTNDDTMGINIINFVYENRQANCNKQTKLSVYRMGIVTSGTGRLRTYAVDEMLSTGDLFFEFPSVEFVLEANEDFQYIYISFLGVRANVLMDRFDINSKKCVFHGNDMLIPIWETAINAEISDLKCEAILLYSFSELGERLFWKENETAAKALMIKIKEYIDTSFHMSELDLKMIADKFLYSEKYISNLFKKEFKTGFTEYISTIRVQHACTLMNQGLSCVSEIACLCGYTDPLYFSKVFKKKMGISPREYIKQTRESRSCPE